MILVLLGTQNNSFHRLLEEIEKLIEKKVIKDEVIVQSGYTKYESNNMTIFGLIPKQELEQYQNKADVIITHGGVGSIISSIKKGKKVIAVPRIHEYNEHVNNHQKEIVKLFNEKGYIIGINEVEKLEEALSKLNTFTPVEYKQDNAKILGIISDFIDQI